LTSQGGDRRLQPALPTEVFHPLFDLSDAINAPTHFSSNLATSRSSQVKITFNAVLGLKTDPICLLPLAGTWNMHPNVTDKIHAQDHGCLINDRFEGFSAVVVALVR